MDLRLGTHLFSADTRIVVARGTAIPSRGGAGYQVIDLADGDTQAVRAARVADPNAALCLAADRPARAVEAISAGVDLLMVGTAAALREVAGAPVGLAVPPALVVPAGELRIPRHRLVVYLPGRRTAAQVRAAAANGVAVMTDADAQPAAPDDADGAVAAGCLHDWAGARLLRTAYPGRLRVALDMIAAIRGDRPPAAPRRALA